MAKKTKARGGKKTKKRVAKGASAGPPILQKVRLPKDQVLEINRATTREGLMAGIKHLRMLRPELAFEALEEVAWRCSDPQAAGGIETGHDPEIGAYADIAVTGAARR